MIGRKELIREFSSFINATASKQAGILIVSGVQGEGKSILLRRFKQETDKAGSICIYVRIERGENEKTIVNKLNQELVIAFANEFGPETESPNTQRIPRTPSKNLESFLERVDGLQNSKHRVLQNPKLSTQNAIKGAGQQSGVIIAMDDFDNAKKTSEVLVGIIRSVRTNWGKRRISFVLGCTRRIEIDSEFVKYIELKPFNEHEVRELVEKALKKGPPKMGDECLHSILNDTDGNPKLVKNICYYIYDRLHENDKIITKGHYLAYLPHIMSMLSREWFGRMYQNVPESELDVLQVIAKNEDGMHVSDIAKKLKKKLGPVTTLTKRLLDRGQIVKLSRGRYMIFSKLYARYVNQLG